MDQWRIDDMNRSLEMHRRQTDRMRPIRFSPKRIQAMSDDEIMAIMASEAGIEGTLYPDTLHLLSAELNRREIQRASKPHWIAKAGLLLAAVAALASIAGVVISLIALKKSPEPSIQAQQPVAESGPQPSGAPQPGPLQ